VSLSAPRRALSHFTSSPLCSGMAVADADARLLCCSELLQVAGEQHAGRAGLHRLAGQVEDPQQAARPERDVVLQGESHLPRPSAPLLSAVPPPPDCSYAFGILCSCQVLIDNIKDFAPIIYTPTVGLVCENYSGLFRRPRGMYFSAKDRGEMMSMIYNWPQQNVRL
jgi:hypothetical protein